MPGFSQSQAGVHQTLKDTIIFFCYSFYFITVIAHNFFSMSCLFISHFPLLLPSTLRTNKTNRLLKTPSVQVLHVPNRSVARVPAALAQNRAQHSPTAGRGGALFTTPGLRLLTASPSKHLQLCGTPCVTDTSAGLLWETAPAQDSSLVAAEAPSRPAPVVVARSASS